MKSSKTRLQLLADVATRITYTPSLFDAACKQAAERVDQLG